MPLIGVEPAADRAPVAVILVFLKAVSVYVLQTGFASFSSFLRHIDLQNKIVTSNKIKHYIPSCYVAI
jgi:hypothetical protein